MVDLLFYPSLPLCLGVQQKDPPRMLCTSHMWTPHDDLFISATYVQTLWKFKQWTQLQLPYLLAVVLLCATCTLPCAQLHVSTFLKHLECPLGVATLSFFIRLWLKLWARSLNHWYKIYCRRRLCKYNLLEEQVLFAVNRDLHGAGVDFSFCIDQHVHVSRWRLQLSHLVLIPVYPFLLIPDDSIRHIPKLYKGIYRGFDNLQRMGGRLVGLLLQPPCGLHPSLHDWAWYIHIHI